MPIYVNIKSIKVTKVPIKKKEFCYLRELGRDGLPRPEREHVLDLALLARAVLLGEAPEQPVGVRDPRHRVAHALQRRRDRDDLLDAAAQPLHVVLPVEEVAQLQVGGRLISYEFNLKKDFKSCFLYIY